MDQRSAQTFIEKQNVLNDFFLSQGNIPGRDDSPLNIRGKQCLSRSKLSSISISSAEICDLLRNLKTDKAVGVDEIPNSLLRLSAPAICHSLACFFKRSLHLGKLPLQWKTSKIMPIHKKGPRDSPDNYRPISLLPAVAKIFEAIVNRQLYEHSSLVCNDLLSPFQSGFRRGDSGTSLQLF